jgi:molybdate transport system substrate-binding protein
VRRLALAVAAVVVGACGGPGAHEQRLVVLAASSLTEAFTDLADRFEDEHPGVDVELGFGPSSGLAQQVRQGASADLFASADQETFALVAGLVGAPVTFAHNRLALLVETGNPKGIRAVRDLARDDVTFVVCDPDVPCGRLAARVLAAAGVEREPASREGAVKAVVGKVVLGEADAGIVFRSDVVAASDDADGVDLPDAQNVTTPYPIAVLDRAANPDAARAWIALLRSDEGQRVLARHGFLP